MAIAGLVGGCAPPWEYDAEPDAVINEPREVDDDFLVDDALIDDADAPRIDPISPNDGWNDIPLD